MKIHLEQIKANDRFHGKKKSEFVDSGFVKTCNEFVIGCGNCQQLFGGRAAISPNLHEFQ